jgi:hypothetical protein
MENRKKGDDAQCCGFFVSVATAEDLPPPRGGVLARAGGRGYGGDPAAAGGAPGEAKLYRLKAEPHWHDEVGETGPIIGEEETVTNSHRPILKKRCG